MIMFLRVFSSNHDARLKPPSLTPVFVPINEPSIMYDVNSERDRKEEAKKGGKGRRTLEREENHDVRGA